MAHAKGLKKVLRKQPINRRVIVALLPCLAASVYFFGWRCLFITLWAALIGFAVEFIFCRKRGEPVSEAVFVTTTIFALIMPATVPLHVVTIGVVFAVMFAKEVFGGFGRNVFNPAMAGRCFIYICFPIALTSTWAPVAEGPLGALGMWTTATSPDVVTGATPMAHLKAGRIKLEDGGAKKIPTDVPGGEAVAVEKVALLMELALGRISGTMGVTSAIVILIGGAYLFWTKTASRTIILTLVISYAALNLILHSFNVEPVPGALPAVLGGGFLFGAFYMATDPVSAPRTEPARIMYGVLIAICAVVIRNFSIFNGGLMFSVLIGNMFAPILDVVVRSYKSRHSNKEQE